MTTENEIEDLRPPAGRQTVSLREWMAADLDQRWEWLKQGVTLDNKSCRVMGWANAFRTNGAYISDETILKVYDVQA